MEGLNPTIEIASTPDKPEWVERAVSPDRETELARRFSSLVILPAPGMAIEAGAQLYPPKEQDSRTIFCSSLTTIVDDTPYRITYPVAGVENDFYYERYILQSDSDNKRPRILAFRVGTKGVLWVQPTGRIPDLKAAVRTLPWGSIYYTQIYCEKDIDIPQIDSTRASRGPLYGSYDVDGKFSARQSYLFSGGSFQFFFQNGDTVTFESTPNPYLQQQSE